MAYLIPDSSLPIFFAGEAPRQDQLHQMKTVFQDAINYLNDLFKFQENNLTDQVGTNTESIDALVIQAAALDSSLTLLETSKVDVNTDNIAALLAQNYITQPEFNSLVDSVSDYISHIDHPNTNNHSAANILFTPSGTDSIDAGVTELDSAVKDLDAAVKTLETYFIENTLVGAHEAAYNHDNYDIAVGWGDHDGLYKELDWFPAWSEVTSKPNEFVPSAGSGYYKAIGWFPSWAEVTDKPSEITDLKTYEWNYVGTSTDSDNNDGIDITSVDLGEAFDFANYDYKFVYKGSTNAEDSGDGPYILLDESTVGSTNAYAYAMMYARATGDAQSSSGDGGDTNANQIWAGSSLIDVTSSGGITMMNLEFTICRSEVQAVSGASYLYTVEGKQQVHSGSGTGDYVSTTVVATFSGSKENEGSNLSSVFLRHGVNDGAADSNKIRIYKRSK